MIISDLHYNRRVFKGIDESRAWEWLLALVDYHKPGLLISLGDWGEDINSEEFYELLRRVRTWSLYGNHENLELLKQLYNVEVSRYERVLFEDGEIREFNRIKFGAINGIVAMKKKVKKGVPRKTPEEYLEAARKLANKIDVLLLHESPKLPIEEYEFIIDDYRTETTARAVEIVKPKLILCGHLHMSPYTVHQLNADTLYVRIDSSQAHRTYAILHISNKKLEVWTDFEVKRQAYLSLP